MHHLLIDFTKKFIKTYKKLKNCVEKAFYL